MSLVTGRASADTLSTMLDVPIEGSGYKGHGRDIGASQPEIPVLRCGEGGIETQGIPHDGAARTPERIDGTFIHLMSDGLHSAGGRKVTVRPVDSWSTLCQP